MNSNSQNQACQQSFFNSSAAMLHWLINSEQTKDLTNSEFRVLSHLINNVQDFRTDTPEACASTREIANGRMDRRAVRRALNNLMNAGILDRLENGAETGKRSRYKILIDYSYETETDKIRHEKKNTPAKPHLVLVDNSEKRGGQKPPEGGGQKPPSDNTTYIDKKEEPQLLKNWAVRQLELFALRFKGVRQTTPHRIKDSRGQAPGKTWWQKRSNVRNTEIAKMRSILQ